MKAAEANELSANGFRWLAAIWERLAAWGPVIGLSRAPKRIRVLETVHLGDKRQLLLISVGTRQLLIGAAANGLATLAELELKREEVAENESQSRMDDGSRRGSVARVSLHCCRAEYRSET